MAQRSVGKIWASLIMPSTVVAVGLAASILVTVQVVRMSTAKDQERFERTIAQTQDSIEARLETYVAMLRAGAGFFAAEDRPIDRAQFHRFAESLDLATRYPGIQGIGFSARLHVHSTAEAEQELASYGVPELSVTPAGTRDEIHAIVHLEPMDRRNQAALGFDMYSEPVRREAMQQARDTGLPAASSRVQLVQEIDQHVQPGFLIYVPVYSGGILPLTERERREKLTGFIYSPFRVGDLMGGIFGGVLRPRVDLAIYDGKIEPANLLFRSSEGDFSSRFQSVRSIEVAGRQWTIRYNATPLFEAASNRSFAPYVLLAGLLATALLTLLSWQQLRATRRADAAMSKLGQTARKLEVLHGTAAQLAAERDPDRLVQGVTDAGRELSGAEIGAFFYNVVDAHGETYQLFTLSGAPREAFAGLGIPRKTEVFGPTFRGEAIVRSGDITADPRFGKNPPHSGFPAGHWPVRSYLAVPVISRTGEVLGGLFFGHSSQNVFDEAAERSIAALAGHAAIAMDNARLFKSTQEEIEARRKIEEHQKLLLDELNHRVKNSLAAVMSISAQTLRTSNSLQEFKQSFERRLIALSTTHNLLSQTSWQGVDLRELVERELLPHGADEKSRIDIDGPSVWLAPNAAVALGMAVHELATNAARHGSLSVPGGRVNVSWNVHESSNSRNLRFEWRESGGPGVVEPKRRGFGTRMIERGIQHDLQGNAKFEFAPGGVICTIEASLLNQEAAA